MRHIAVIGGGVAGLTVAFRRSQLGDRVTLFEGSARLGGQLHTEQSGAFLIEHGAEGYVAGSEAVGALAASLGIADAVLDQRVTDSCHFDGETLVRLAPGQAGKLLGFQVAPRALGKGIQSFRLGMRQLVETLESRLGPEARCLRNGEIMKLARVGSRWQLLGAAGLSETADSVVVATSAARAAVLLAADFGAAAAVLESSEALSSVTVSLAFSRADVAHALDATGFVVAEAAQAEGFRACTFASSKLPGRARPEFALLRLFFRPTAEELSELDDSAWVARAERCAGRALAIRASASASWVSRWERALPVFDAVHRERVRLLEERLHGSGVSLAGAAFHGSGIDGAVRSADAAASHLDV